MDVTAPLRAKRDIYKIINIITKKKDAHNVLSLTPSRKNPYFNMVNFDSNSHVHIVGDRNGGIERRQDAPEVFDITTVVYVANSEYILKNKSLFLGRVGAIEIPQERSIDIDTKHDFEIAKYLLENELR